MNADCWSRVAGFLRGPELCALSVAAPPTRAAVARLLRSSGWRLGPGYTTASGARLPSVALLLALDPAPSARLASAVETADPARSAALVRAVEGVGHRVAPWVVRAVAAAALERDAVAVLEGLRASAALGPVFVERCLSTPDGATPLFVRALGVVPESEDEDRTLRRPAPACFRFLCAHAVAADTRCLVDAVAQMAEQEGDYAEYRALPDHYPHFAGLARAIVEPGEAHGSYPALERILRRARGQGAWVLDAALGWADEVGWDEQPRPGAEERFLAVRQTVARAAPLTDAGFLCALPAPPWCFTRADLPKDAVARAAGQSSVRTLEALAQPPWSATRSDAAGGVAAVATTLLCGVRMSFPGMVVHTLVRSSMETLAVLAAMPCGLGRADVVRARVCDCLVDASERLAARHAEDLARLGEGPVPVLDGVLRLFALDPAADGAALLRSALGNARHRREPCPHVMRHLAGPPWSLGPGAMAVAARAFPPSLLPVAVPEDLHAHYGVAAPVGSRVARCRARPPAP